MIRLDVSLSWLGLPDEVQAALRGTLVGLAVKALPSLVGLPAVVRVAEGVLAEGVRSRWE
jgi:hypothetical protein